MLLSSTESAAAVRRQARSFQAPDSGPGAMDYCCTFHWFRLADGRIAGLDVIRSDDLGMRGLRVFVAEADGALRALIHEAPTSEWAPFAVDERPALNEPRNTLGRGAGWVAGSVRGAGLGITEASFSLEVHEVSRAGGPGVVMAPELVNLDALDYLHAHTTGTLVIDGEPYAVDAEGPCSIHYGRHLPDYAYLCTVPGASGNRGPSLLLASVHGDNLRWGGRLLGDTCFVYAVGDGAGLPPCSARVGTFDRDTRIGLGGRLRLHDIRPLRHTLEGRVTTTATAHAVFEGPDPGPMPWQWLRRRSVDLGRVVLDYRGAYYVERL